MKYNNFVSDYFEKQISIDEIDDYIKYWHTHKTGVSLRDFLGFTDEEYLKWMKDGNGVIKDILLDRVTKKTKTDKEMTFLDAVLIARTRGLEEEVRVHNLAPDLVLATKTLVNGMDAEIKKAKECGYVKGFADAEKEKYALAGKVSDELDKLDKVKSLLHAHTDFSRETPEVNYELVAAIFHILDLDRDQDKLNETYDTRDF